MVRGRVVTTTKPKEKLWRLAVERAAREAVANRGDPVPLFTGPVRVTLRFTFEPPATERQRIGQPHTHKPDKDNLEKLVLDAMQRAGIFKDDGQVAQGPVEKWWGERAGVVVLAEPIDAPRAQAPIEADDPPAWLRPPR